METKTYTDPQSLCDVADDWRKFNRYSPCRSPEWQMAWWRNFGGDSKLQVVVANDDRGDIRCIAPLHIETSGMRNRICFLGSGHACTDYQSIFTSARQATQSTQCVAAAIDELVRRQKPWPGIQLELEGVIDGAPWHVEFCSMMQGFGYIIRQRPLGSSYVIDLPVSMECYLNLLSKAFRRKPKKMLSLLAAGERTFHHSSDPKVMRSMLLVLESLHQRRQTAMGKKGSFAKPEFGRFLSDLITGLSPLNQVEIQWCCHDGDVVAIQFVLKDKERFSMYVSGVDPDYLHLEPGHLLVTASIENAISRGISFFDFMRGDEPYKKMWGGKKVPMVTTYMTPSFSPISLAMETVCTFAEVAKKRLKVGRETHEVQVS